MDAKPFVKWAGGKGNLLSILNSQLPDDFAQQERVTYIEPFVGGGAMLFRMLNTYQNIKRAIINDINKDLIRCYELIKHSPQRLIELLTEIEYLYYSKSEADRKAYYYELRKQYNTTIVDKDSRAAVLIFLNHTCYNGLYRENAKGEYNVPYGRYKQPKICNVDLIMVDHKILKRVDIICGDYKGIITHLRRGYIFIYLDPPYRPLQGSANFNQYSKSEFGDAQQEELKDFCDKLTKYDCRLMLSNSDSTNPDGTSYFEKLYEQYNFDRVLATRFINAHAKKRQRQSEVIIKNY